MGDSFIYRGSHCVDKKKVDQLLLALFIDRMDMLVFNNIKNQFIDQQSLVQCGEYFSRQYIETKYKQVCLCHFI